MTSPIEAQLRSILLGVFFGLSVVVFVALLFVDAPYGRHARPGWGPRLGTRTAWILMEAPAALVMPLLYVLAPAPPTAIAWLFLVLWEVHYLYRSFVYPLRLPRQGHGVTLVVVLLAVTFNTLNGTLIGRHLSLASAEYGLHWLYDPRFLCGLLFYLGGLALNRQSDRILLSLRKPGESGYRIPRGGAYRWVSCPNYLGELVQWSGFALLTWSLPGLCFACWTAANLVPRALAHHRFYLRTFPDYPTERRAILPFVL